MVIKHVSKILCIKVYTNSRRIYNLIENILDLDNALHYSKPKVKIDFYLNEVNHKNLNNDRNFFYRSWLDKNNDLLFSFGNRIVTVTVNPKIGAVKGSIFNYQESYKEHILYSIFMQPLRFILAHHGLFYLHASVVCRDKDCLFICGPQDSGKSTLALVLSQNGFNFLGDDDCFVKLIRGQTQLFPFPTKMGLNDRILNRYPELNKYILRNYRYGGKRRLSLNSISNSNNTKGLRCKVIIFPKYKAHRNLSIEQLSKKEGLDRLVKENLMIYNKEMFPKLSVKNFEVLCSLTEQADSFELTYNDNNLNKIPEVIKKLLIFKK